MKRNTGFSKKAWRELKVAYIKAGTVKVPLRAKYRRPR